MAQTFIEIDSQTLQSTCERCGYVFQFNPRYLHGRNYDPNLCSNCKAKPTKSITKNGLRCVPWDGDFDLDTDQPMRDGQPFMPGKRTCGNADCVNRKHVIKPQTNHQDLIAEQHSISYRTGKQLTYEQLLAAVKKEGNK